MANRNDERGWRRTDEPGWRFGGSTQWEGDYGREGAGKERSPSHRERGYWSGRYGYEGDFGYGDEEEYDKPVSWSSAEVWLIPGPYTGMGPKGYQRSDDRIREDVCERLTQHGQLDASNIKVEVKDSEVTLKGKVDSRKAKRMAEYTAESVTGVWDVHNQLRVERGRPEGGQGRRDEVGRSGVYPASGPLPPGDAEVQGMASWGQGERGAEGYHDSGESELRIGRQEDT